MVRKITFGVPAGVRRVPIPRPPEPVIEEDLAAKEAKEALEKQKAEIAKQTQKLERQKELTRLAERLIFQGKEFAARDDPELQKIIRRLKKEGQRSVRELQLSRLAKQLVSQEKKLAARVDVPSEVVKFKGMLPKERLRIPELQRKVQELRRTLKITPAPRVTKEKEQQVIETLIPKIKKLGLSPAHFPFKERDLAQDFANFLSKKFPNTVIQQDGQVLIKDVRGEFFPVRKEVLPQALLEIQGQKALKKLNDVIGVRLTKLLKAPKGKFIFDPVKKKVIFDPDRQVIPKFITDTKISISTTAMAKWILFSPFLATGAAKKGSKTSRQTQKVIVRKTNKDAKRLIRAFENEFKKGNQKVIVKKLGELIKIVKNEKDPFLKEIGIRNLKLLTDDLIAKEIIRPRAVTFGKIPSGFLLGKGKGVVIEGKIPTGFLDQKPNIVLENLLPQIKEQLIKVPVLKDTGTLGIFAAFRGVRPKGRVIITINDIGRTEGKIQGLEKELESEKIKETVAVTEFTKSSSKSRQNTLAGQLQKEKQKLGELQDTLTDQLQKQPQVFKQPQLQAQPFPQPQILKQQLKFARRIPRFRIGFPTLVKPVPFLFPPIPSPLKKKKLKVAVPSAMLGYNAFARTKGKFEKLNRVPLTKRNALNLSSFIVDNSVSATGGIRKTTKPPQKSKLRIPKGYFSKTQNKYRFFKIVNKKKVITPNSFIEKRKHRIDTSGEKKQLSVARALARLKKPKTSMKSTQSKPRTISFGLKKVKPFGFKRV